MWYRLVTVYYGGRAVLPRTYDNVGYFRVFSLDFSHACRRFVKGSSIYSSIRRSFGVSLVYRTVANG